MRRRLILAQYLIVKSLVPIPKKEETKTKTTKEVEVEIQHLIKHLVHMHKK